MATHTTEVDGPSEGVSVVDSVNEEIRVLMVRRGLTQTDLARVLPVSQPQMSARLGGRLDWRLSELCAIADWLGVSLSELFALAEASRRVSA